MKFLCPKCKAKYQIADDKLQGRAVRMKCRKCGHVIKIPARVRSKKTSSGKDNKVSDASSRASDAAPKPPRPSAPGSRPSAPRPSGKGLARPSASGIARPSPATSSKAPSPRPSPPSRDSDSKSGLHGAFIKKAKDSVPPAATSDAPVQVLSAAATEEWYVGINGVPVGPVRLSTLRQKATAGAIDEESLVWREGFEEWLPLKTFPELLELVTEARAAGVRPSFAPPVAAAGSVSSPPAAMAAPTESPDDEMDDEDAATIIAPGGAAELIAQAQAGAGGVGMATASNLGASPAPVASSSSSPAAGDVMADPFANDSLGDSAGALASPPPGAAAVKVSDESGAEVPPEEEVPERQSIVDELALGVKRQVRMHPAAYVLIAVALGFGITAAVVLLMPDNKAPAPATTQVVIVKTVPGAVASSNGAADDEKEEGDETEVKNKVGRGHRVASHGTRNPSGNSDNGNTPNKNGSELPKHRVGLGDGPSISGPSVAGPGPGSSDNLPSELSQSDVARVVSAHRALVRRRCWQPALASKSRNAPKSAKVNVSLTIGPSGHVTSVNTSGGAGYPGLASCIATRVRRWTFPRAAGSSRASIPFVFVSQ